MEQTATQLSEVVAKALKLSVKERLQLIEQVAVSIGGEIAPPIEDKPNETEGHWGRDIVNLLNELGPIELVHPEIEDPVEWVKQIRRDNELERGLDWSEES